MSRPSKSTVPSMAIGSDAWPGLAKLAEECAEVQQVIAKLMAYPNGNHPDGAGALADRLRDELGDLLGAVDYVTGHNRDLDGQAIQRRRIEKHLRFERWHREESVASDAEARADRKAA